MSLNVTGYPLEFDAVINTDGLASGVKSVADNIKDITNPLQASLKGVDDSLADLLVNLRKVGSDPAVEQLFTKYAGLMKQQLTFQDQLSKTTNPEDVKNLNDALTDTGTQMKEVGNQVAALASGPVEKVTQAYTRLRQLKQEMASITDHDSVDFTSRQKEAVELQKSIDSVNKGLKIASQNEGGLKAIGSGVRGLIGGFEALSGVVALFGGNTAETEKATKAVIGAMGVLNGLTEVAAVLDKDSAVNIFLKSLAHKESAASIVVETGAMEVQAATQEATAVATEAATVAQEGLNVAMLANPVGIILGSLLALYAAYEVYSRTLGAATDAEKEHAASVEITNKVNEKAIDGYAKEQASLTTSIAALKDKNLSDKERNAAFDDIRKKYPEYLSNLSLENITTAKGNDLIDKQIGLLKARSVAQAAGDIYAEKLKEQLKIQNEIDRLQAGGKTTIKEKLGNAVSQGAYENSEEATIRNLQKELKDAVIDTNAAFDKQVESSQALASAHKDDIAKLNEYAKSLQLVIEKSDGFVKEAAKFALASTKFKLEHQDVVFKPEEYDKEKKKLQENAQYKIDLDKNSFANKRSLIDLTFNEELGKINLLNKASIEGGNTAEALQQTQALYGKYYADINALGEQERQKNYQNEVNAANAVVTYLSAAGKEGSEAYYNAKINASRANAAKELDAARSNAEDTKHIYAQLALELAQIEVDRKKSRLEDQKAGIEADLAGVKEGSEQELALKIRNIAIASDIELAQLSLTENKKNEIRRKAAKEIADLNRSFLFQEVKDEGDIRLSTLNTQLSAVLTGSKADLDLKKQVITEKASLDVISANQSIKNEQVKLAKIAEINAKALQDALKLQQDYNAKILQEQLTQISSVAQGKNATLDLVINDKNSNSSDVFEAKKRQIQNDISAITSQLSKLDAEILATGDKEGKLGSQYDVLKRKYDALRVQMGNIDIQGNFLKLDKTAKDITAIGQGFSALAGGVKDFNSELASVITTLANIGTGVVSAIDQFKKLKEAQDSGDTAGAIGAGIGVAGAALGVVSSVIGFFKKQKEANDAAKKAVDDFHTQEITGEVAVNDEYRKRLVLQAQINKLKIEGIEAERKALLENQQSTLSDYQKIFALLQKETYNVKKTVNTINGPREYIGTESLFGKSYDDLNQLFLQGKLEGKAKELFQTLQQLKNEGIDIDKALADNKAKADELFTGTTSSSILDSIVQGFAQGKRATADFADNFQDLMRQSIINSFKYKALEKPIQDFYSAFAAASESDGTLTAAEIQQLQSQYDAIIRNAGLQFDQLSKLTNIDLTGAAGGGNSLKGAIKGITETQAELLAGQFGALRVTAMSQLQVAQSGLLVLNKIENNTSRIAAVESYLRKFDTDGIKIR